RLLIGHSLRKYFDRWAFVRHALWGIEGLVLGSLHLIMSLLPTDFASSLGKRASMWLGPRQARQRKFKMNFALAFPDKSDEEIERLATAAWGNLGSVFAEYAHLAAICRPGKNERLEVIVKEDFETLRDPSKPAVFVSGHLANWEVLAAAISRLNIPVTATYTPPPNPWLNRMLVRWRRPLGCKLVQRDESVRPFIKELVSGRSIGLALDQRVDSGKLIPFFGIGKYTTLVPARLALRHGCELIPVRSERLDGARFRATFYPPIRPDDESIGDQEKAKQMTRKLNDLMEDWIRARPEDWFCSKRIWPKGAESVPAPEGNLVPPSG
ncbi:MAG: lysophospholipid acyltransferase family protein, partial [Gammaproteobacteria bacterium]